MDKSQYKIDIASFQSICRVCLSGHEELISIYNVNLLQKLRDEEVKLDLVSVFQKYCNIGIHQGDCKPQKICTNCLLQLQGSFNFFELCIKSDEYLNNILFVNTEPLKIELEDGDLEFDNLENKKSDSSAESDHSINANEIKCREVKSSSKRKQCRKRIQTQFKGEEKFTCLLCEQVFTDINSIIDHCDKTHEAAKICIICNKAFVKKPLLRYHMSQHSKKALQCKPCRQYFQNEKLKEEHFRKYDHSNPLVCHICGKKFTLKGKRNKHMIAHFGEKNYKCSQCDASFIYRTSYIRHYRKHFGKEFLCYVCGKAFTTNFNVQIHIKREHESADEKKGQKKNSTRPYKKRTIVMQEVKCEYCEAVLPSRQSYVRHRQGHREFSDYPCKFCKEKFTTKEDLQDHMKVHNRYICSFCGKGFPFKCMLDMHFVNHKELNLSRVSCPVCNLPQRSAKVLKTHMLTHTGEKPCVCQVCGKCFRQPPHLTIHMYQHTGKKPHKCEVCGKAFAFRYNMVSHMRIHTGERPYPCPYCDKAFRDSTILHKHKKKIHPALLETETQDL